MKGMEVLLQERRKNGEVIPMMVVISDGRANVPVSGDVRNEVLGVAEEIRSHGIRMVVIDTEEAGNSFLEFRLGYCRVVAEHAGGGVTRSPTSLLASCRRSRRPNGMRRYLPERPPTLSPASGREFPDPVFRLPDDSSGFRPFQNVDPFQYPHC